MKRIFWALLGASVMLVSPLKSQNREWCGVMPLTEKQISVDPQAKIEYEAFLQRARQFDADYKAGKINATRAITDTIFIPIVFHVIHNGDAIGSGENISDAQILSQIDVLNEDFALLNSNSVNIPTEFKGLAGKTNIRFCMALFDPQGNVTNGIDRINLGQADWDQTAIEQQLKPSTIWDRTKYLNVWVVRMGGTLLSDGVLAYAQFPFFWAGNANTDGVVARFNVIGKTGSLLTGYDKGRSLGHEIGHWLGLYHIWGDDQGKCANQSGGGSDNISDTPDQADQYFGCPSYPQISCGSSDMFMNYMDYTNDDCRNMFSKQQCARMENVIKTENSRKGFQTAYSKCFYNLDVALEKVVNPKDTMCHSDFYPIVYVRNKGIVDVSYLEFKYAIDNVYQTYVWNGNLPARSAQYVQLPIPAGASDGYHQFNIFITNPNGVGADNDLSNDSASFIFQSYNTSSGQSTPYSEGFEASFFPPADWDLKNPNNDAVTWKLKTALGAYGQSSNCAMIENQAYTVNPGKRKDALLTPVLDMNGVAAPRLSFDYAYSKRTNRLDSLEISFSVDCGKTWNSIWKNGGVSMATTPFDTVVPYIPADSEWKTVNVPVNFLNGQKNVQFRFENITNWGNVLYLDNINLSNDPNGIENTAKTKIAVTMFPNPASNSLTVKLPVAHPFSVIEITDNLGRKVLSHNIIDPLSILNIASLNDGVYNVTLVSEKLRQTEKLVVVK